VSDLYRWQTAWRCRSSNCWWTRHAAVRRYGAARWSADEDGHRHSGAGSESAAAPDAEMLVEQLVECMPELSGIGPWHSVASVGAWTNTAALRNAACRTTFCTMRP